MSLNKVMLIGNVGRDPEIRHLDTGVAITTITLATSEVYTDKNSGQRVTNTEWHNVVLWHQLAELAEKYIRKGSQIFVEGKIRARSWDDKNGQKRYTTEIVAENVRLLGRREDSNAGAPAPARFSPPATQNAPSIDDPMRGNNAL
ncbi:MAG: single-stranded DNA-binding protein [Prevotellaceae bacterium]|jgi:single-strand DNA-binding protein|nr:single-stranded DNA-binding protein [Prevotellaceae bacterium]